MFAYPGMGKLIFDSIMGNDFNVALVGAAVRDRAHARSAISRADLGYAALDPRISFAGGGPDRGARAMTAFSPAAGRRRALRPRLLIACRPRGAAGRRARWATTSTRSTCCALSSRPRSSHPLGTDEIGRDVLLRLLYGGRVSLSVGLVAAVVAAAIGTVIGLHRRLFRRPARRAADALTDGVIALPLLPLLIVLAAVDLAKLGLPAAIAQSESVSLYRIIVITALVGWTTVARLVRGATLSLRGRDFVRAAIAIGASAAAHHGRAYPAQRRLADHRRDHARGRQRHPVRIGAELPRPRHPAADRRAGATC